MKLFFSLLTLLLVFEIAPAQMNFDWAKTIGNGYNNEIQMMIRGNDGSIYSCGNIRDSIDFDMDTSIYFVNSAGTSDFIMKTDADGVLIWVKTFNGTNSIEGITIDQNQDLYITGWFKDTIDFNPGVGIYNMAHSPLTSGSDIFILKLDSSGNFLWAKQMGQTNDQNSGRTVTTDINGNVILCGDFGQPNLASTGVLDIDPGVNTYTLTTSGKADVFIIKLTSSGNFIWAKSVGGPMGDVPYDVTVDLTGNIYISGALLSDTADFDPGFSVYNLYANHLDAFLLSLDSSGNFRWAFNIGGESFSDIGQDIELDDAGYIYLAGTVDDTADFDPGPGIYNLISTSLSAFVARYDLSGNFNWAAQIKSDGLMFCYAMTRDNNYLYITGSAKGNVDFDPGSSVNGTLLPQTTAYVLSLDTSGNFSWYSILQGQPSPTTNESIGFSLLIDNGNVYTAGTFSGTIDFDPDTGSYNLTSVDTNTTDIYFHKLSAIPVSVKELKQHSNFIHVFPNPSATYIKIKLPETKGKLTLYITDVQGKIVGEKILNNETELSLSTKNMKEGIYFIYTDNVRIPAQKFIVKR